MSKLLRHHPDRDVPVHRLPFIGETEGRPLSHWAVPKTGGYSGGCRTGEALATACLKHLREHGATSCGFLQNIVLDMAGIEFSDSPEESALRGQIVGFFSTLEPWLALAAQKGGGQLDHSSYSSLADTANLGLCFCEETYDDLMSCIEEEVA